MSIRISAIICTHNRAGYLRKAIRSLVFQSLDEELYEILVVDNASTDDTRHIVHNEFSGVSNLRYLYEPVLGLSQARNTGWRGAEGEYVAYLDDDAVASPVWLERILEVFDTVSPKPGCVGGKIEPIWEAPRPIWLSDSMLPVLTVLDLSDKPTFLSDQIPSGANISFAKVVLMELGGFSVALGRKGNQLLSNEEVLLMRKMKDKGFLCFYHPEIKVRHHIPASRLTERWFLDRYYWQGISDAAVYVFQEVPNIMARLCRACYVMARTFLSPRHLLNLAIPHNSTSRLQSLLAARYSLGYLRGIIGAVSDE